MARRLPARRCRAILRAVSTLTEQQQAANLRAFFAEGVNSVTRERIFFNRLAFDLKIAAARAGYHLHLYEPDVDRDGFDIVVEDQHDGIAWFQLKAVLRSAGTGGWETTVGFLRSHIDIGDQLGFDPAECGRGGGVILIEIDDTTDGGDVIYSYTDFRFLAALAERYLVEDVPPGKRKQGRPKTTRQAAAASVVKAIRTGRRAATVMIPRAAFVEVRTPRRIAGADGADQPRGLRALRHSAGLFERCHHRRARHRSSPRRPLD